MIFAGARWIYELELNIFADAFQVAVSPEFPWISAGRAAALPHGAVISATSRMRFDFVRRSPKDIDVAAIGLPSGNAGRKTFIGIGDAPIVVFFEGIFSRIRIRIAELPEMFDELFAFLVGTKPEESRALFGTDDIRDFILQPIRIAVAKLFLAFCFCLFCRAAAAAVG